MVEKVNGRLLQGSWFERDTSIVTVTAASGTPFSQPSIVNGTSEQIMKVMQTRGTVIAYTVESDTVAHFMFGHAAGAWDNSIVAPPSPPGKDQPDVLAELQAMLNAAFTSGQPSFAALEVFEGFKGIAPLA